MGKVQGHLYCILGRVRVNYDTRSDQAVSSLHITVGSQTNRVYNSRLYPASTEWPMQFRLHGGDIEAFYEYEGLMLSTDRII